MMFQIDHNTNGQFSTYFLLCLIYKEALNIFRASHNDSYLLMFITLFLQPECKAWCEGVPLYSLTKTALPALQLANSRDVHRLLENSLCCPLPLN